MAAFGMVSSKSSTLLNKLRLVVGTVTGIAITYGVYKTILGNHISYTMEARSEAPVTISVHLQKPPFETEEPKPSSNEPRAGPAGPPLPPSAPMAKPQPSVSSHDKAHALFMCIRVKDGADARQVASSVAKIQQYVDEVEAPTISCCGNFRIFAGVGFGPEFYRQLKGGVPQPFSNAKHELLSQDSVGGDILIHAKSNKQWMLERLSQTVLDNLPADSILSHQETYGEHKDAEVVAKLQSPSEPLGILNYQYAMGEIELLPPDSSYNPSKPNLMFVQETGKEDMELRRRNAAVDPSTGGSYVLTQRWVHDVEMVDSNGKVVMNQWVDKAWEECARPLGDHRFKPLNALGADLANKHTDQWMSEAYKDCLQVQKKYPDTKIFCSPGSFTPVNSAQLVRQSVPYRKPGGEFGLFFISYCRAPRQHEVLMDRLIASTCSEDKLNRACSEVFKLSHNVHSACWYFPGLDQLKGLQ